MKRRIILCVVLLSFFLIPVSGEDLIISNGRSADLYTEYLGKPVRVETESGASFQGTLTMATGERLELLSPDGQYLLINSEMVETMTVILEESDPRQFYQDSVSNRLLFLPTAFPMGAGDFHVAAQEIIVITSSYGLSDRMSLWGAVSPFAGMISGRFSQPVGSQFAVSAGGLFIFDWTGDFFDDLSPAIMPYALASGGSEDNNITGGTGVIIGFPDRSIGIQGVAATLGGKRVITSTLAFINENWFFLGSNEGRWNSGAGIVGLGFRIVGNRFSWDIGALTVITFDEFGPQLLEIPIPWLSLSYRVQ